MVFLHLFNITSFVTMLRNVAFLTAASLLFVAATAPHYAPVYQEIVAAELPLAELRRGTVAYLHAVDNEKPKRQRGEWQANADSTQFTYESDFLLYNRKAVKHPIGEITYRTTIDLKDGKYRYTADSAYFQAYRRDRYSRYGPSRGPAVAWETVRPELSDKEQQRAFKVFDARFHALKNFMQAQAQLVNAAPTTSEDW